MITLHAMRAKEIGQLFNSIAKRYDLLNMVLSLGIDRYWRKKTSLSLTHKPNMIGLDVATGTAEQLISIFTVIPDCQRIVGLDASSEMVEIGKDKLKKLGIEGRTNLIVGDACHLPFSENEFDFITCSFGIRNIDPFMDGLQEMNRVLKKGGQLVILEFTLPRHTVLKTLYLFYFRYILPVIGAFFSKHKTAYSYLNTSVEAFQKGDTFLSSMRTAGFSHVSFQTLTFGVVSIYMGVK